MELHELRNVFSYFYKILVKLLSQEEMVENANVKASHEYEQTQVKQINDICHKV